MDTEGHDSCTLRTAGSTHHILVGAAANSFMLPETAYAEVLGREFSVLEAENEMKFSLIHPRPDTDAQPYEFAGPDKLVAFAKAHGMSVRGHTLVWHNQISDWVKNGGYDSSQLATILHSHIERVMGHYAGQVYAWDVVNEAFEEDGSMRSTLWYDAPGIGYAGQAAAYIEQAFRWARHADPAAKLFYNDYNNELLNAKSDAIYAMAEDFKKRGVPLDGIGFQMHIEPSFDDPGALDSLKRNLERFAGLDLDLHITEMDVRMSDNSPGSLAAQAKLYGVIAAICRTVPRVKLLQTWGFTDKYSWIPSFFTGTGWALLWDETYHKKPAHEAILSAWR